MKIDYFRKEDLVGIRSLVDNYEFNDYRNYRILRKEVRNRYFFKQIKDMILKNEGATIVIAKEEGKVVGLVSLLNLGWDSRILGFKMARIGHLITGGCYKNSLDIKRNLASFILGVCKRKKIAHLSCRVDRSEEHTSELQSH